MEFIEEIAGCISGKGAILAQHEGHPLFKCRNGVTIIPIPVCAASPAEAEERHDELRHIIDSYLSMNPGQKLVLLPEDLWRSRQEMMKARLLAQLGEFRSVFARNTTIRRITGPEAAEFLNRWHTYGDAASRYRYGIFAKDSSLVAVATFSSGRRWLKGDSVIRSYEWVRYASLPWLRITGGMGKALMTFIREVEPDDIMSYADMEWTDGQAYIRLGLHEDGFRSPVMFCIDRSTWRRTAISKGIVPESDVLYHLNFGSRKFRLECPRKTGGD